MGIPSRGCFYALSWATARISSGERFARVLTLSLSLSFLAPPALAGTSDKASRIYTSLTTTALPLRARGNDTRRAQMEAFINQGQPLEAAKLATQRDEFFNLTLRSLAMTMSTRNRSPYAQFNDFVALFIGTVRDERDARELLRGPCATADANGNCTYDATADAIYQLDVTDPALAPLNIPARLPISGTSAGNAGGADVHFIVADNEGVNFRRYLRRVTPQDPVNGGQNGDTSGLLTTVTWGMEHLWTGTNRRSVAYAFEEFLCTPIQRLMDASRPDNRVRQDVDRAPGGISATYQTSCRACHAGLDAVTGGFAYWGAGPVIVKYFPGSVSPRFRGNTDQYPAGYQTIDNTWINYWTTGNNANLGWNGATTGKGVRSFGRMLADSSAFSACMARRVFQQVCGKTPEASDQSDISALQSSFEADYNLRLLFARAAILPQCMGQ